tara:strand:- start:868 stop:1161 length:294 start_codon:yes stop_codon:yes gene_type:complete
MIKTIVTGGHEDPRDFQDDTEMCRMCDMNRKYEDTDVCEECIDELDEMSKYSYCCSASIDSDILICTDCKDHSETALDSYCEDADFNRDTYKYNKNK